MMERFFVRRAVERLRDGLLDPVAVSRLTMEEPQVHTFFSKGLQALSKGEADHLCICGSYGQGKTHLLNYLNREALAQGYATSMVSLDIREVPFHQFDVVYRLCMDNLSLPGGETFPAAWKRLGNLNALERFPTLPHRFRMILAGLLSQTRQAPQKHSPLFQPKEASVWLEKALNGHPLPLSHLKNILHNRHIENAPKAPLACRGNLPHLHMVQVLGKLLKEMGYKGLVLFFDEAESITQGRITQRAKSYEILDHFFQTKASVYPIFACTDDFFTQVNSESYADENPPFPQNYAETWKHLKIARLRTFLSKEWDTLQNRLIELYAEAYQIPMPQPNASIKQKLQNLLDTLKTHDTRLKLKALVQQLDIETQQDFLKTYSCKAL